jgi:hypothetical protein
MSRKAEIGFGRMDRQGVVRAGCRLAAVIVFYLLAACSGTTAVPSTAPIGGLGKSTSTPAADSLGVYPPPADGAAPALDSKSVPHAEGTNAVYLPAIINEKPPQYPFEIQPTGVLAVQGFFGCNWIGVAGQVFGLNGAPIQNLILHLEGLWNGTAVSSEALTGSAGHYGPAGYEFILGTQTLDSTQTLWIQVMDGALKQVSPRVYLNTYNDCARNLILVNFVQVR